MLHERQGSYDQDTMPQNIPSNIAQEENDSWKTQNMWVQEWGHLSARSHVYSLSANSPQSSPKRDKPHIPQLQCTRGQVRLGPTAKTGAKTERQQLMRPGIRDRGPLRAVIAYVTVTKASSGNRITVGVGGEQAATPCRHASVWATHQKWCFPLLRDDYTSAHRSTSAKITAVSCSSVKCIGTPSESSLPVAITPQLGLAVIPRSLNVLNLTLFF